MKNTQFTVYIEQDEDGIFVGSIPSIQSCYAQGKTQEEMLENLLEVVKLCLRNQDKRAVEHNRFVGVRGAEELPSCLSITEKLAGDYCEKFLMTYNCQ